MTFNFSDEAITLLTYVLSSIDKKSIESNTMLDDSEINEMLKLADELYTNIRTEAHRHGIATY